MITLEIQFSAIIFNSSLTIEPTYRRKRRKFRGMLRRRSEIEPDSVFGDEHFGRRDDRAISSLAQGKSDLGGRLPRLRRKNAARNRYRIRNPTRNRCPLAFRTILRYTGIG